MTRNISFIAVALLLAGLAFGGCQNQVDGCTDPNALNYDPNATQDDGSCQYSNTNTNNEAGIVFWHRESTSNNYLNSGTNSLRIIVDGVVEGTQSMLAFDAAAPACNAANRITVKKTVPNGTTQLIPYFMKNQDEDTLISGALQFRGGHCYAVEIPW